MSFVSLASKQQQELLRAVPGGWMGWSLVCIHTGFSNSRSVCLGLSWSWYMGFPFSVPHGIGFPRSGASIWYWDG